MYEYSATALDNCLFTTERIIAGNKGKLCRCFFSAKATQKEDGSIVVKPAYDVSHSDLLEKMIIQSQDLKENILLSWDLLYQLNKILIKNSCQWCKLRH